MTFSKATYRERRKRLKEQLGSGVLLFLGNEESPVNYTDNCYHFRQDSNFLYFFGIDRAGVNALIDLDANREMIFGDELTTEDIIWSGPQTSIRELAWEVGIEEVRPSKGLAGYLSDHTAKREVHYLPPYRAENALKISNWLGIPTGRRKASVDFIKAVIELRACKSDEEILEMSKAVNTSGRIHLRAREMCRSGRKEAEICGALHEIAIAAGGFLAYPPIVTVNGQTLHNHYYGNTLKKGQLLLTDAGAESASHYAGDITRTFPVDGKFTTQQKEIYSAVLMTEKNAIRNAKPGVAYSEIHRMAMVDLAESLKELGIMKGNVEEAVNCGAHALFCPHGLGHMIGLDVHDMEDLGEDLVGYNDQFRRSDLFGTRSLRLGRTLQKGFVVTVEPGLYFIPDLIDTWQSKKKFSEFIHYDTVATYRSLGGVRIEDNILINRKGSMVIGEPILKEVEDVVF